MAGGALTPEEAVAEALVLLETVGGPLPRHAQALTDSADLTTQEKNVLRLLAEGYSDRESAAALSISPRVVGRSFPSLLAKLGIGPRIAVYALPVAAEPAGAGSAPVAQGARPALPDGLSVREVAVLRLVAGGMTNREIADHLFLSVRTVERHLLN